MRPKGLCGLLATNTIAQGDTREVGLDQMVDSGWSIIRAIPSRKWPGAASLEVARVWLIYGIWCSPCVLDEKLTEAITTFLVSQGSNRGNPYSLIANKGIVFKGHNVQGMGFVLDQEEAYSLLAKDLRNQNVLFPLLNGEDLNSRYDQSPSRWVINFHDWPLEQAETYPDCMEIVRTRVKPERDLNNRQSRREQWWKYGDYAKGLELAITDMKRVLVRAQVSKNHAPVFIEPEITFSNMTIVFALDANKDFSVIQSHIHEVWVNEYSSTLETRQRYTPSDCFETFPFPQNMSGLDDIGERYYTHRQSIILARQEGLTKTYNRFHDPQEKTEDIVTLRELHREMDKAVAKAYGWDDLKLEHGFHETKQGLRYTISEAARREVLDRLLLVNHQRHEEEVRAGLFEQKGTKRVRSVKNGDGKQQAAIGNTGKVSRVFERNNTIYGDNVKVEKIEGDVEQGALFSE